MNTGSHNVATGSDALENNAGASNNTAIGFNALLNSTGAANLALGSGAGKNLTTGSNNVDIANQGVAGEAGTIRIGTAAQTRTFLAGVAGKTIAGPTQAVVVDSAGRLGRHRHPRRRSAARVRRSVGCAPRMLGRAPSCGRCAARSSGSASRCRTEAE